MDRRIKIRHLRTFVEISRLRSLKQAGASLGLTQPAVSKTLRELEVILGAGLMLRDRGGVRLTPAGEVFEQFARSSLSALQQGVDGVARLQGGQAAVISVGALPSVAARVLPRASLRFRELAPGATLLFEDGPHGFLIERLRAGTLDLVVGRMGPPATMQGVSFTQLYSETVAIVARPGHPMATCSSVAGLRGWPVIYPSASSAIRPLVDRLLIAEGLSDLADRVETVSGAYGRGLARNSDALWFISEGVVADDIDNGLLVKLPVDMALTSGPVGMMTRAEDLATPVVQLFRRALIDAARDVAR